MFPWENFEDPGIFSVQPNQVNAGNGQREFDRKFRKLVRANRRRERALGPRLERWKWQRFLDGDFSGLQKEFDEIILIPVSCVLASIVVLGMFIVQLDFVDEQSYRRFMMLTLVVFGLGVILLRCLTFYAVRIWVVSYGEARVEDAWILNSSGRIEEVTVFDESEAGE